MKPRAKGTAPRAVEAHDHVEFAELGHEHMQGHLMPHNHELPEHSHEQEMHTHELAAHGHELPIHTHEPVILKHSHDTKHGHPDLRGHMQGAVRALLAVLEVGSLNSEQQKAIHKVRVTIGDAHGTNCLHENTAYEAGDVLVCLDCREVIA